MATDKSFLGTGWAFPPQFSQNGTVKRVTAEDDIRESLYILLSTNPGERTMQPTYGCGLKAHVFEEIDEAEITVITDLIRRAILFFEPRIIVERIDVDTENENDRLNGLIKIQITYIVRSTNNRHNIVYPFYFTEGTNVRI
ncbi:GPW/gp25 family protein [Nitrosomonas sp.]|uniref:GPW/gp25 family protein n=1 Tax=Nitrosomonas sp. TaxID=42353 RepID=UPI001E1506A2|nr:GPW/gp25 family protein [Nitrosomonas sp.]MCB1947899.1 GPW/gp25 family protein [Nitrosomonas sp.]MCP5243666.1 GPW/gp25 family protein [Burkholderiales bacterium]MDR4515333.1 GPW/gp25 family protein [Nitrosomonas sp.]